MIAGTTPGYEHTAVYLDGVELPYVLEADDVEGYAYCDVAVWTEGTPVRELDAEDAQTGEPMRVAFATVPEWHEGRFWKGFQEVNDGPLSVIVRGKVEFRKIT